MMDKLLSTNIVQWDIRTWFNALDFWDQEAHDGLARIAGDQNARRLVSNDEDDRRAAIERLVPKGR